MGGGDSRFCAIGWHEVIGGIFSLDGFFRAFSTARDFTFQPYGKGAEIVSQSPRETIKKIDVGGAGSAVLVSTPSSASSLVVAAASLLVAQRTPRVCQALVALHATVWL
jgi:hypothetical protein